MFLSHSLIFFTMVWSREHPSLAHTAICQPARAACAGAGAFAGARVWLATSAWGVADLSCIWLQNNFFYARKLLLCIFFFEIIIRFQCEHAASSW